MPGTIPIVLQQQSHPAGEFRHSQLALAYTLQVFDGDQDKLILFVMRIQQQPKCEMKLINFCGVLSNDCMLNKQCVGHDRFAPLRALSVDALQLRLALVTSEGNQSGNKRSHRRRSKKIAKFHQRRLTQKCRDARSFLLSNGDCRGRAKRPSHHDRALESREPGQHKQPPLPLRYGAELEGERRLRSLTGLLGAAPGAGSLENLAT